MEKCNIGAAIHNTYCRFTRSLPCISALITVYTGFIPALATCPNSIDVLLVCLVQAITMCLDLPIHNRENVYESSSLFLTLTFFHFIIRGITITLDEQCAACSLDYGTTCG